MEKKESLNFIENDIVFIYGKFDDTISTHVIPGFFDLVKNESKKKDGKIVIDINSHGGYTRILYQLLAIIENAKSKGVIVETRALGVAMSCGSILAASGTKGNRFISENTTHLCHLGSSGFRVYTDTQLDRAF
jgi:ATP-dependent protease ClpP protease subunit